MILITTAGKVGAEAARLLPQRAELVRVLVRDREKAAGLAQAGVEVAVGLARAGMVAGAGKLPGWAGGP